MTETFTPPGADDRPRIIVGGYDVFFASATLAEPTPAQTVLTRGTAPVVRATLVWDPTTASAQVNLAPAEGLRSEPAALAQRKTPAQIEAELFVGQQLAEISQLDAGWLDGRGSPISSDTLRLARMILTYMIANGRGRPQIAPTPEGGVQAEWSYPSLETSVTFEASGEMYLFSMNLDTHETRDELLSRDFASVLLDGPRSE